MLEQKDINILRELAARYMEYVNTPEQEQAQKLWIAHNKGKDIRPVVMIDQGRDGNKTGNSKKQLDVRTCTAFYFSFSGGNRRI